MVGGELSLDSVVGEEPLADPRVFRQDEVGFLDGLFCPFAPVLKVADGGCDEEKHGILLEKKAALRFELRDGGFAGPCLTTWLCRHA